MTATGLAGHPLGPTAGERAGLATLVCAIATFLTAGAAMWAQLTIGWQWSAPGSRATAVAMTLMSVAMLAFACLAGAGLILLAASALWAGRRELAPLLSRPAVMVAVAALILVLGGRHFGNGWPGTGGHWWPQQGLVPGGVAAFAWACTLWVSSYWGHPAALASFPAAEIAWMVISPAAAACLVTGIAQVVRRVPCAAPVRRAQAWLGTAAAGCMAVFLSAAACWVTEGGPGPRGLFHAGVIDVAGLAVMAGALAIAGRALQQIHRAHAAMAVHR
jgi:hypothetical protein